MLRAAALVVVFGTPACEARPHPWQGKPLDRVNDESTPFLPKAGATASLIDSSGGNGASGEPREAAPRVTRAGGHWRACALAFASSGQPRRDVERLGLLCGPTNGMRLVGEALEGRASQEPSTHAFAVERDACYRIFGVAESSVADLALRVVSVRGSQLAAEDGVGPVAMLETDRAFCTFANETVTAEVTSKQGTGRYALRIYQLPTHE